MSQRDKQGKLPQFPSPEERERIVRRREELSNALYLQLAFYGVDPQVVAAEREELIREYGAAEVQRMLDRIRRQFSRPTGDAEEPWLYCRTKQDSNASNRSRFNCYRVLTRRNARGAILWRFESRLYPQRDSNPRSSP